MKSEIIAPVKQDQLDEGVIDVVYGKRTARQDFIKQLTEVNQSYVLEHKPFSYLAAKKDFIKEQERLWAKNGKRIAENEEEVKIEKFDFKKYADPKRFKLIKESDIIEQKIVDGLRRSVVTGKWQDFQDINNGYKISVEVPNKTFKE